MDYVNSYSDLPEHLQNKLLWSVIRFTLIPLLNFLIIDPSFPSKYHIPAAAAVGYDACWIE